MKISLDEKDSSVSFISLEKLSSPTKKDIKGGEEFWFSEEAKEEFEKKEELKRNSPSEIYIVDTPISLSFSDNDEIKREGNKIIREGENEWEHCLMGDALSEGVYKLSLRVYGSYLIGLFDSSQTLPSNGRNLTENHFGLLYIYMNINYFFYYYLRYWNK